MNKIAFVLAFVMFAGILSNRVIIYDNLSGNRKQIKIQEGETIELNHQNIHDHYNVVSSGAGVTITETYGSNKIALIKGFRPGTWLVKLSLKQETKNLSVKRMGFRYLTVIVEADADQELTFLN